MIAAIDLFGIAQFATTVHFAALDIARCPGMLVISAR